MNTYTLRVWYSVPEYGDGYSCSFDIEAETLEEAKAIAITKVLDQDSEAINYRFDVLNVYECMK